MTGIFQVRRGRPRRAVVVLAAGRIAGAFGLCWRGYDAAGNTIDRNGDGDNDHHAASAVFDGGRFSKGERAGERPVPLYRNARAANTQPVLTANRATRWPLRAVVTPD